MALDVSLDGGSALRSCCCSVLASFGGLFGDLWFVVFRSDSWLVLSVFACCLVTLKSSGDEQDDSRDAGDADAALVAGVVVVGT